jgi:hypothetical protein
VNEDEESEVSSKEEIEEDSVSEKTPSEEIIPQPPGE